MQSAFLIPPRFRTRAAGALLLGCMLLGTPFSAMSESSGTTVAIVPFAAGGVGEESQAALTARVAEFNVKIVFALKTGEYLAKVWVGITDGKGKALLETTAEGPWMFARLADGPYTIVSTFEGKSESQKITIAGNKLHMVNFRW